MVHPLDGRSNVGSGRPRPGRSMQKLPHRGSSGRRGREAAEGGGRSALSWVRTIGARSTRSAELHLESRLARAWCRPERRGARAATWRDPPSKAARGTSARSEPGGEIGDPLDRVTRQKPETGTERGLVVAVLDGKVGVGHREPAV